MQHIEVGRRRLVCLLFFIASPHYTLHSLMLEELLSQMTCRSSAIYLLSSQLLVLEDNPKTFPKVVLYSQVNLTCVSSGFDSSSL